MRSRDITVAALFTALALILFTVEAQIPLPIPLPGVKLGLANVVTVTALYCLGKKKALAILLVRILLGSLFAGFSTLPYSLAGGLCSIACVLAVRRAAGNSIWVCGIVGAMAHSLGQLCCAALLTKTPSIFVYAPPLLLCAIATGLFTGLCTQFCVRCLEKHQ